MTQSCWTEQTHRMAAIPMTTFPHISPSYRGVAFACAFVGTNTGIFGDGRSLRTVRSTPICEERRRVWAFIRAAWGWSFPEIAKYTNTRHNTVFSALKTHGMDADFISGYRTRLMTGSIAPARPIDVREFAGDEPVPCLPPVPPETPKKRKRKPTAAERRAARLLSVGIVEAKRGVHALTCHCAACTATMDTARRLAARPDLQIDDVDLMFRDAFARARAELAARGAVA